MEDRNWLVIFSSVLIAWLLYAFYKKWCTWKLLPPGPWGLPIVGYLPWLDPAKPYLSFVELSKRYGPIYSLQMGRLTSVVITDPKTVKLALNMESMTGRGDLYLTHGVMKGHGLICSVGSWWKEQRKFAVTCLKNQGMSKFHPKRERLAELITSKVKENIEMLNTSEARSKEGIEFANTMMHCLGNVMNNIIFGTEYAFDDPTWKMLQNLADEGVKLIGVAGPLNFLPFLKIVPKFRKAMEFVVDGLERTHKIYEQIVEKHRGDEQDVIGAFLREKRERNEQNSSFTDLQLNYLMADLFGAGLDTTLTTLRWFFLLVALNPPVQKRIHEDIDAVLGDSFPSVDDMSNFPYLEASLAECQRIRTVIPTGIPHGTTADCSLGPYLLPKGTMVIPLLWALHMNPDYWPEPDVYKPERFLDAEGCFHKPEAYMPFQTGKRVCLGEELARMMLFLFAAGILKEFEISVPQNKIASGEDLLEGECGITLVPKHGKLIFKLRKSSDNVL